MARLRPAAPARMSARSRGSIDWVGSSLSTSIEFPAAKPPFLNSCAVEAAEPCSEIPGIKRRLLHVHGVTDTGYPDQAAIRHCGCHCREIGRRNPAVLLAPEHEVRLPDLAHAGLELAALLFQIEIERRADPDAFRNSESLRYNLLKEGLDLAKPGTELRRGVRGQGFRREQRGRCRCHHRTGNIAACHHGAEQTDLL